MKNLLFILIFFFLIIESISQVRVKGYYRKDGTYVRSHYRSYPNTKRSYINTKQSYSNYINKSTYSQDELFFLSNCVDLEGDNKLNQKCFGLLIKWAAKNKVLRKELTKGGGIYSDYNFFGIDLNLKIANLIRDEVNSLLFQNSENLWINNTINVYPSNYIIDKINFSGWGKSILLLPKYKSSDLKEITPIGLSLISKNKINNKKFHRKVVRQLIKKYGKPSHKEGKSFDSYYNWIGLNFKIYFLYSNSDDKFNLLIYKSNFYESLPKP